MVFLKRMLSVIFQLLLIFSSELLVADEPIEQAGTQQQTAIQQNSEKQKAQDFYVKAEEALRQASADQFYGKAIYLYQQAIELGHENAKRRLLWLESYLPNETSLKARYRRELALAKEGKGDAQFAVADMCEFGIGVEKDFERALYWYKKAASRNHGMAQNRLGELYAQGLIKDDHAYDAQQALNWIESAAQNNQADAQFKLANFFLEGRYVEHDEKMAFYWFKRAADLGHIHAQLKTGFMLKDGQGIKQDYEQALVWFEKAAAQGNEVASQQVKDVNFILDEIFLENFK